jgi:TatD DNase family protein
MIIDSHAHLYSEQFDDDIDTVIQRALTNGVQKILLPNIDIDSIQPMLALCEQRPETCYPMMGLHPCSVSENFEADLQAIWAALNTKDIVAIGEIGIDLYWDKSTLDFQRRAFRLQVEWAKKLGLPIVIHARDSYDELFEELDELNDDSLSGVFHCFTGTVNQGKKIIDYGNFYLGIGGVVTFKRSGLDETLAQLPIDRVLVETDSPYLAPAPFRGKRNESAYVSLVVEKIADIFNISTDEVSQQTTENTKKLFKKLQ